jgi:integrase/recombinase XerD
MNTELDLWLERYRTHLELEGLRPRTVEAQVWLLGKFTVWCREAGLAKPADLTTELVGDYRRHRIERVNARGKKDTPQSVNLHLVALRSFLTFLERKGVVPALLKESIRKMKQPRRLPKPALSHEEVLRILERIPGESAVHLRDRAILEILYSTALRRQELVDLEVADVDVEGGVLVVQEGKGGKGRTVPLGSTAGAWVVRYLTAGRPTLMNGSPGHDRLFVSKTGLPLTGNVVREIVLRWTRAAGIKKAVSPHTFRRSCATGMIRNRANPAHVKDLLGHEDYGSLGAYVCLEIVDLKDAHRRFHPREQEREAAPRSGNP